MDKKGLILTLMPDLFGVCRLNPNSQPPDWFYRSPIYSVTRTPEELSIVCRLDLIPTDVTCEKSWRCMKVAGPIDFSQVGVLSSLSLPLADAGISIFMVSTYDTDYLMVKEHHLDEAIKVLSQANHAVQGR